MRDDTRTDDHADLKASYGYLPALDGFRAVSILLVVISHAGLGIQKIVPGGLGVLVFFVISGFLITRQMIAEVERKGTLGLKSFYLRRFFRLAPALIVYVAVFTVILSALGSVITLPHILSGLLYFANYYHIFVGYTANNPMPIIWSLAVEEHFYILFPFCVLAFAPRLPRLLPWLAVSVLAALLWRMTLTEWCAGEVVPAICGRPGFPRMQATDSIFDLIIYGCMLALALHYYPAFCRRFLIHPATFAAAALLLLATMLYRDPAFRLSLRYSLQAFAVAIIIANTLFDARWTRLRALLSLPFMVWVGRLSYSLYLYHFGVLNVLYAVLKTDHSLTGAGSVVLYLAGAFACAVISFYLVEQPMLRLRKHFGSHAPAPLPEKNHEKR